MSACRGLVAETSEMLYFMRIFASHPHKIIQPTFVYTYRLRPRQVMAALDKNSGVDVDSRLSGQVSFLALGRWDDLMTDFCFKITNNMYLIL